MEESPGPDGKKEKADLLIEVEVPETLQQASASFMSATTSFVKTRYIDMKQPSGRFAAVFPCSLCTNTAEEEEYFLRMLAIDAEKT